MDHPEGLSQWTAEVTSNLPCLSVAEARVLALWSYGMALTRSCACHTVALFLGLVLGQGYHALRQRLREWCYDAADKRGRKRRQVEVTACFAPLLGWVLRLWAGSDLALALDATSLGDRFVVLSVSVLYRGCAIPVAWRVLPANTKGAWRREWLVLLRLLRPAVPPHSRVLVLADRGLYARWLFRRIVRLGWHPFLRVNRAAKFHPTGQDRWCWLSELVGRVGQSWAGTGTAFASPESRLVCTLVACWAEGHEEAWYVLTDLSPATCQAEWYQLRAWIEQGFKVIKGGGWQWQQTRMSDPARAERLWLALAVATLWAIGVGEALERRADLPVIADLLADLGRGRPRRARLFRLGLLGLLAALAAGRALPLPSRLTADPWPGADLRDQAPPSPLPTAVAA